MNFLVGLARRACLGLSPCLFAFSVPAQDDYEIQVYGSETVPTGKTMVELHSNYTIEGERRSVNGVLPSYHAFHETLEITQGFTPWFETHDLTRRPRRGHLCHGRALWRGRGCQTSLGFRPRDLR